MSQFQSVRCDECQRIQDGANHWLKIMVWKSANAGVLSIGLGKLSDLMELTRTAPPIIPEVHDLCGQGCAVKHIAKLLKWNLPEDKS